MKLPGWELNVDWRDYPRLPPGEYRAYVAFARIYAYRPYRRWTCLIRFEILSPDLMQVIARIPYWLNLGKGNRPYASRCGKYLPEWVRANGGPPVRRDRLSPKVFRHRMVRVEVRDNASPIPYSVVKKIIEWETGHPARSLNQQVTQSRKASCNENRSNGLTEGNGKLSAPPGSRA